MYLSLTTCLSGVQTTMSGNITQLSVSQSLTIPQPTFYLGEQFIPDNNPFPFIVWHPTHVDTGHIEHTLGKLPRSLYLEKINVRAHIIGQDFEVVNFLRENIIMALRVSPFWWSDNFTGRTKILNPRVSMDDFWHEEMDFTVFSPVVDLLPLSASISTINFVTSSAIAVTGALQVSSGSF